MHCQQKTWYMYWLYSVLVCAVSRYLGDMDTEGGPSVQEDETTPLLPPLRRRRSL